MKKTHKDECESCHCKTTHYYNCKLIRAEKILKINEIKNPWNLSWNELIKILEQII